MDIPAKAVLSSPKPSPKAFGTTISSNRKWCAPRIPCSRLYSGPPEFYIFSQPDPKGLFTIFAVTDTAVFIINMPTGYMAVISIPLSQLSSQSPGIFLIYRAVGARIMTFPKFVVDTVKICAGYFWIAFYHPGGQGSC